MRVWQGEGRGVGVAVVRRPLGRGFPGYRPAKWARAASRSASAPVTLPRFGGHRTWGDSLIGARSA